MFLAKLSYDISGEIVEELKKKLFDDLVDSGISESSVTSKIDKELAAPSGSHLLGAIVKNERESSVDSYTTPKENQSRKRKLNQSSDSEKGSTSKKIKIEPLDEDMGTNSLREKRGSDSSKISKECSSSQKKSKKKKHSRFDDDFETSLQLILNAAQIKQES